MEIRVLRYFLTAAQEENITRAAEKLHLTQPTLSRQLSGLEEELGQVLFLRGKRKITLTEAGRLLQRRAGEILELCEKTEREIRAVGDEVRGTITIGSGESMAARQLIRWIRAFSEKYPGVTFEMHTGNADRIRERLDHGLLDLALLLSPGDLKSYGFLPLKEREYWGVLTPKDSPLAQKTAVTPQDLKGVPLITASRPAMRKQMEAWFGGEPIPPVAARHDLIANAALMAREGMGTVLTIEGAAEPYANGALCFRRLSPELTGSSFLVWKPHQPMGKACACFLQFVKNAAGG